MSSNDSLDCFQRQLSWLTDLDERGIAKEVKVQPPALPLPHPHLYPLETLRDIYVNLLFTISVPHPRNDWILTEFELPMLARGRVSIQQYNGHFGKTILCCRELSYILQNISQCYWSLFTKLQLDHPSTSQKHLLTLPNAPSGAKSQSLSKETYHKRRQLQYQPHWSNLFQKLQSVPVSPNDKRVTQTEHCCSFSIESFYIIYKSLKSTYLCFI